MNRLEAAVHARGARSIIGGSRLAARRRRLVRDRENDHSVSDKSNYVTTFPPTRNPARTRDLPRRAQRVARMEDARFVRFTDADGSKQYYATYTAYDGFSILPQLIETERLRAVHGLDVERRGGTEQGHGAVPAPDRRQVRDAVAQRPREPALATSSDVHRWNDLAELYRPQHPWELLQVGNCGSPIETAAGWLVLTHGVGPMRRYAIGAHAARPRRIRGASSAIYRNR